MRVVVTAAHDGALPGRPGPTAVRGKSRLIHNGSSFAMQLTVLPATPARWPDVEAVFGARGCSLARGCWCMYYRHSGAPPPLPEGMTRAAAHRAELKALIDEGRAPGLLGYRGEEPVGWVSLAPREEFAKLKRSPIMKALDDREVWSVICFVVPSAHRGEGVARALLDGAIAWARRCSRLIPWTSRDARATTPCGSVRSPCSTRPDSRRSLGASPTGRWCGSSCEAPRACDPAFLHRPGALFTVGVMAGARGGMKR